MIGGAEPRHKQGGLHRHQPGADGAGPGLLQPSGHGGQLIKEGQRRDRGEAAVVSGLRRKFRPSLTPRGSMLADNLGSFMQTLAPSKGGGALVSYQPRGRVQHSARRRSLEVVDR
jgi:hypothetical protein